MTTLKVLIVDDASFIRDLIKRSIRSQLAGVTLDEANDGKRALGLLNRNDYQLILCDWEMPEVSGLEVLKALREQEQAGGSEKTPFIMVTSRGDRNHVAQAVEAGVSDYIGKPFTSDQLMRKIIKQLAKQHKATLQELLRKGPSSVQEQARSAANSSADTLLGGHKPTTAAAAPRPVAGDLGGAAALMGQPSAAAAEKQAPVEGKVPPGGLKTGKLKQTVHADLRFPDLTLRAQVEDLNLRQALLRTARDQRLPQLFEQVALDIELGHADRVARLNGFVFSLQATSDDFDCASLLVNIRFTDDDPEKYGDLSRFIARVR